MESKLSKLRKSPYIKDLPLLYICIPGLIAMLVFQYIPMFGLVIAFKDYNYIDGILGSPWCGFKNFEFFFRSNDATKILFNTLAYNIANILLTNFLGVLIALLLYEVNSKSCIKFFQTSMALPSTISAVVIAYICYSLLAYDNGLINTAIENFGGEKIMFYNEPKYWPTIIVLFQQWSQIGMGMLLYYGTLMGADAQIFEAAEIDGATKFQRRIHIAVPILLPVISLKLILGMGAILGSSLGMNYQLPMGSVAVLPTTDVISTYLLRGIQSGNMGINSAIGLFQNGVGAILLLLVNGIVRKMSPENAIF